MPALEWNRQLASHHEIHRRLEATGGAVAAEVVLRPRFDYARDEPRFRERAHGVLAADGAGEVLTVAGVPGEEWTISEARGEARARVELEPGESRSLVLRWDDDEVWPAIDYRSDRKLEATRRFWRSWSGEVDYRGDYRRLVERSALTLKLLFYAPTGAVVAAPTTSLPEVLGGERNWDYRFSWLRDATYTLSALHALGKHEEIDRYMVYLKKVCRPEAEHLQIMFGVGGERGLPEAELEHLEGYEGSGPVRVGNAASGQFQLDVYGEVLDSIHVWRKNHRMTEGMWELCRRLATHVCDRWTDKDHGVWEVRGPRRHYVFSKVMAWVALDRAVRIADDLGLNGDEGAFWVSSFQLAQVLALAGREEEARELFESAVGYAGPLGLFSEQVDPDTGRMLGNFPQAFSHIGLINAAHVLDRSRRGEEPAPGFPLAR